MGRLSGKVAIVTGGASGIGEATVRRYVEEGAKVLITDIQTERGAALAAETGQMFRAHDVSDEGHWIAAVDAVVASHGRLDIVVNNAGMFLAQTIEDATLEDWNRVLAVNLTGVMLGCKHGLRAMKANPGGPAGSLVNVSSITGFIGLSSGAAYTASKGGVRLLTKSVAVHAARTYRTIRCNSIHPGAIDTPMNQAAFEASGAPEQTRAFFETLQPVGRMAASREIADVAVFLGSDESSFVTGTEIVADGGWLAAAGPL